MSAESSSGLTQELRALQPILQAIASEREEHTSPTDGGVFDVPQTTLDAYHDSSTVDYPKQSHILSRLSSSLVSNLFSTAAAVGKTVARRAAGRPCVAGKHALNLLDCQDATISSQKVELMLLKNAISELPAAHRKILKWRFLDGKSHAEIAHMVDRTEESVLRMLDRTLKLLNRKMQADEYSTAC